MKVLGSVLLAGGCHMLARLFLPHLIIAIGITKILPIIILIYSTYKSCNINESWYGYLIVIGLILSCIGDLFLVYDTNTNTADTQILFFCGLFSFLLAHLSYICAFCIEESTMNLLYASPVLVLGVVVWQCMWPETTNTSLGIKSAVFSYTFVLCVMLWRSAIQPTGTGCSSKHSSVAGALLFAMSDTILSQRLFAYERILYGIESSGLILWLKDEEDILYILDIAVMVSYYLAQYCIARGAGCDIRKKNKDIVLTEKKLI
eukprot:GHVR01127698.1.p1 GENE.GHVR01127698.1~~GHVR01127698.1.p1  ORF type:complete len:261 (+),score=40.96 GHVR01127698.1:60-842(+)